ncbi:MAG: Na+/H+ antiporter subunit E [Defluviitaleaceae bacterium]|nr:Na+/H+ antiporter subunit E [Defluviitaleaceae bacterium]
MGKRIVLTVPPLAFILVIFMEEISVRSICTALIIGLAVVIFTARFLPLRQNTNISYLKLITFPIYLIGLVYISGFQVIKIILKRRPIVDIVTLKTSIKSEVLQVILADSITLTPGSVLIDLENDSVNLLWIRERDTPPDPEAADKQLKEKLERRLLKAERKEGRG